MNDGWKRCTSQVIRGGKEHLRCQHVDQSASSDYPCLMPSVTRLLFMLDVAGCSCCLVLIKNIGDFFHDFSD